MKIIIEVLEDYDRVIKYRVENGKVVFIDFLQGTDEPTIADLMQRDFEKNPIIDIYNNLIGQEVFLSSKISEYKRKYKINHAIELYIIAYIFQEF
jgi:hypothetical protein